MSLPKITLVTSFFSTPYNVDRAPYNEQLFKELKAFSKLNIIRPIPFFEFFKQQLNKRFASRAEWNGIDIQYTPYFYVPRFLQKTWWLGYYFSVARSNGNNVPDLFYTSWAYPDAYAVMMLAKKLHRPFVVRVHGSDINILLRDPKVKEKVLSVLEGASLIVSPSRALKEIMVDHGVKEEKVRVIYSGVDRSVFFDRAKDTSCQKLGLDSSRKRVLFIGNLKESKGVVDLLNAFREVSSNITGCELLYVGSGPDQSILEEMIVEYGLQANVRLVGKKPHASLGDWICASDVVALPSYAEGVPNVLLEAMACNRTVVSTTVGGIPEIVDQPTENLVGAGDISALSKKISSALSQEGCVTQPSFDIRSYEEIAKQVYGEILNLIKRPV